jgi:hypothetical protein
MDTLLTALAVFAGVLGSDIVMIVSTKYFDNRARNKSLRVLEDFKKRYVDEINRAKREVSKDDIAKALGYIKLPEGSSGKLPDPPSRPDTR